MSKKKRPKNAVDVPEAGGVLAIESRNAAGEDVDASVLDESDVAFDPTTMHLQLTKVEKRRTTALMLSIQAYQHLIIKDAEYLREVNLQSRTNEALTIRPATMEAMVRGAIQFDAFISGRLTMKRVEPPVPDGRAPSEPSQEEPQSVGAVDPSAADPGKPSTREEGKA